MISYLNMRDGNTLVKTVSPQDAIPEDRDSLGFRGEVRSHMEKLLTLFRQHMIGTHNNKSNSADRAVGCIRTFTRFTGRPIWLWTLLDLPAFITHKNDTIEGGFSHSSQAGYITYLRTLQNFLMGDVGLRNEIHQKFGVQLQEWVNSTNSVVMKTRRKKRKKVTFALSGEEFGLLMAEYDAQIALAFETNSKARYPLARDKVMTQVAYTYGLRVTELVTLHLWNFVPDKRYPQFKQFGTIDLIGKGDFEASIHALDPEIVAVMEWYLEYIRPAFQDENTKDPTLVFYSERGVALCDEQFRRRLGSVAMRAGIKKKITPHVLRRSFGTDSMDLLGPIGTQKNIRHKDISTTFDSYYRPDPDEYGRDIANAVNQVAANRRAQSTKDSS